MDQILHTDDTVFAQIILNDLIVRQRDALLVDLAIAALVDEIADGFQGRIAVSNVRFNDLKHFRGGLCETDEDAIVYLEKAEELKDFAGFGGDL